MDSKENQAARLYSGPVWAKTHGRYHGDTDVRIRRARLIRLDGKEIFRIGFGEARAILERGEPSLEKNSMPVVLEWWPRETWWTEVRVAAMALTTPGDFYILGRILFWLVFTGNIVLFLHSLFR